MLPFVRAQMTYHVVTMALPRVVSEIFSVEKYRDLVIPVRGQLRSLKVVPFDRLDMPSYVSIWIQEGAFYWIVYKCG